MGYPTLFRSLVAIFSLAPLSMAAYPEISDDRCDCYLTNGSSSHYFTTHKFFDFRDKVDDAGVPAIIEDADESSEANATSSYLSSDEWTDYWAIQSWNNAAVLSSGVSDASVLMAHSPNNVYIEKNQDENADSSTYLTMRTARLDDFQTACEFESAIRNYQYLSVRMYARTVGAPGAVTAMFTYRDIGDNTDLTAVQESDLEIRTLDPPDRVQYTNQPSYTSMGLDVQEATRNVTIPNQRDWTNWAVYRMDWSPGMTTWYIDGDEVASISFQAPRDPSMLIFNSWSDGGSWAGNMSVGSEADLQIQWIELVYNTTGSSEKRSDTPSHIMMRTEGEENEKRDEGSCYNICSIDQREETGTTTLVQGSAPKTIVSWVVILCLALFAW
ncbi:glycoside hydrolase family 16 protein [Hypoxylon rubiginosum]|uniref:Glycoside hydrolase family 16 protein n=1 Tax=Hypoxylon rubiginosum TaxID=110542 RepID=A0ACB9ZE77_9PEZI|nr:glycoside hydrolase family 16 protein [Hypoxylon rubiginosum]